MKTDLVTSIIAAIICVVVAYFVCNLFLPQIAEVTFKTLETQNTSYELTDPNPEVFNYRAIDPAVEVYVGPCTEYDANGNCLDSATTDNTKTTDTTEPEQENTETEEPANEETNNGATD